MDTISNYSEYISFLSNASSFAVKQRYISDFPSINANLPNHLLGVFQNQLVLKSFSTLTRAILEELFDSIEYKGETDEWRRVERAQLQELY